MGIVIDHENCVLCLNCVANCPFGALSVENGRVEVNANCKLCKLCLNNCPVEAISLEENRYEELNKDDYRGIIVYVEHDDGLIHPVTYELIGKARELAAIMNYPVYAVMIGYRIRQKAEELLAYGVDRVLVYDHRELEYFRVDNYTNAFEEAINYLKPSSVLVGATTVGRSLAPSVATRFRTGLTADTTVLEMREDSDLIQIRPAFGGNIMAQIKTTNNRPQFATVRYKVMNSLGKVENPQGVMEVRTLTAEQLASRIRIISYDRLPPVNDIADAEIIVVAGSGVRDEKGLQMVRELAQALGGTVGYTRPMVEKGIGDNHHQIGLSGRSVKPRLIITCGVSGAIQFTTGMNKSDLIIAINSDRNAPIFRIAHVAVVGDLYEILPELLRLVQEGR